MWYRIVVSSWWCVLLDLCCIINVGQDSGQFRVMCTFKIFVVSLMWYRIVVSSGWCVLLDLCCIINVVQDSGQFRVVCTFKICVVSLMYFSNVYTMALVNVFSPSLVVMVTTSVYPLMFISWHWSMLLVHH